MSEYERDAVEFLRKHNIRFSQKDGVKAYPDWDNGYPHFMHECRFCNRNTKKSMTVKFYGSRSAYERGEYTTTAYDVLACLQKYEVGSLDDFISEFGYEIHSAEDFRRTERTWKAVKHEYKNVERVFGDCLDELRDIS